MVGDSQKINMKDRNNNFDFLRILFSSLVIFSHSYALTFAIAKKPEPLLHSTNSQLDFGSLAVNAFFVISGYLVFISLRNSRSALNFIWKRLLRILPGLFVLLVITIYLLPLFYSGINIFLEPTYWTYLPSNLTLYRIQFEVKGVFESNPMPKSINGSLWSLTYEFSMYLYLLVLFRLRNSKLIFWVILSSFLLSFILHITYSDFLEKYISIIQMHTKELYRLASYFLGGSLLTYFNLKKYANYRVIVSISAFLVIALAFSFYKFVAPFFLPILVLLIGVSGTKPFNTITKPTGDISYGVYIYGFFVQQILMYYFSFAPFALFTISVLVTYIIAYLSWQFVEKRALKNKNFIY